jgi:diguanylate cyclase (GGDEF)-like protein
MSCDADRLRERDNQTHRDLAWVFWLMAGTLSSTMAVAFPPTHAVGTTAGWTVCAAFTVAMAGYIVRLYLTRGELGEAELALSCFSVVVMIAVLQWLAGGYRSPIQYIFALHIFGGAAVLTGRVRAVHLLSVLAAVLAPIAYGHPSTDMVVAAVVWALVLTIMAGFLLDYGRRFRAQRYALYEAEREASARAVTDPLTGLGNRRALELELARTAERIVGGEQVTVVYLDLDGFKTYNDRLGHGAGDALLQRLGGALTDCLDGQGRAFRIGGDEFCVVLDGAVAGCDPRVEAIRTALSDRGPGVTIAPSCGVVCLPAEATDGPSALRLADARMYEHKRGRPRLDHEVSQAIVAALSEQEAAAFDGVVDLPQLGRALAHRLGLAGEQADAVAVALEPGLNGLDRSAPAAPPAHRDVAPRAVG